MNIRIATTKDKDQIHQVHYRSFSAEQRDLVADLAIHLLTEQTTPPVLSLVTEIDSEIVAHIAFSPLTHNHPSLQAAILAPLAVLPAFQKQSIGSALIDDGMARLREREVDLLFVYGDPDYYTRFGFSAAAAANYQPPAELALPFGWLAMTLGRTHELQSPVKLGCAQALADPALW